MTSNTQPQLYKKISNLLSLLFLSIVLFIFSLYTIPLWGKTLLIFLLLAVLLGMVAGLTLIFVTVKSKIKGRLRNFLLLTGVSAAGILPSMVLHNIIYGAGIFWLGEDFWNTTGLVDEPVFFMLAVLIFPLGLIIGLIGSWRLLKGKKQG